MIKVLIKENSIRIKGHANYSEFGKDIVCASVSSVIYTTVRRKDCSNILLYCVFGGMPILYLSMGICTWFFPVETGRYEYTAKLDEDLTVLEFAEFQETYTDIEYIGDNIWRFEDKK